MQAYLAKLLGDPKALANRVAGLANGILVLLVAFSVIDWSTDESLNAIAVLTAFVLLVGSVWAHFQPGSPKEWALVGGTLTAFVTTLILFLDTMDWVNPSEAQTGAIVGLIALIFGVGSAEVIRQRVTPVPKDYPFPGPVTGEVVPAVPEEFKNQVIEPERG